MISHTTLILHWALWASVMCAAILDMRWRLIPNWLTLGIALGAPLFWIASGLSPWPDIVVQITLGFGCFVLFALAFAAGVFGGGDVKLIAALALWFPPHHLAQFLVLMGLLGGGVGLVYWVLHKVGRSHKPLEIPYGVAIAAATHLMLWEPNINPFG